MITVKAELERLYKALEKQTSEFEIAIVFATDRDGACPEDGKRAVDSAIRADQIRHAIAFLRAREMIALRQETR